ncbi:hypothetical protein GeomeDRAFT_0175 [Geobacter metallireducens RCH3]|uniref:Lipoprotein, putative n=2 Tax=Geobacter metallireducens TaxID=28232 RepID=Q39VH9_GEOMG|nr:lipoprotein, putative [Geobacter metallireducens GS-15]EHP89377.1 hypothetical protein GeomeDRAFT_0175 [Geobacter metallireducens RCH3]
MSARVTDWMTTLSRLLVLLVLATNIFGCSLMRSSVAALKSTAEFVPTGTDRRVFAEPGAEDVATVAAKELAEAIATVEREQHGPFAGPVEVYVTRDEESFAAFTGVPKEVRGAVILKIFLSGGLRKEPDRIRRILTHELSHLHLGQRLGMVYGYNATLPSWFQEGLAVVVSGGGGAEKMSEEGAVEAILKGKSIIPEANGSFFFKKFANSYGLTPPMFYRQSGMFVAHLQRLDEARFRSFLLAIKDGHGFGDSFAKSYGMGVDEAWQQFTERFKRRQPSAHL